MRGMEALLARLCPDGVEFKAIGSFGELVRGNGMPKADFVEVGVGCIHYGQIYTHYGIWATETKSFVPAEKAAKLAKVQPGDLIVTNTSENMVDVCKAVAWLGDTEIVTGGHATVLKHDQDAKYLSYYLQTPQFFADKKKHATGTKVIDVSAKSLAKIKIPIPPIEIQREIVAILDRFTKLEAELEAELEARHRQYRHYRHTLLNFDVAESSIEHVALRDLVQFINAKPHEKFVDPDGDIALITARFVSTQGQKARLVKSADVLTPAIIDDVALVMSDLPNGKALAKAFYVDKNDAYAANQRVCLLRVKDHTKFNPRFLYYVSVVRTFGATRGVN